MIILNWKLRQLPGHLDSSDFGMKSQRVLPYWLERLPGANQAAIETQQKERRVCLNKGHTLGQLLVLPCPVIKAYGKLQ